jgi:glycogen(starch) synthase
MNVFIHSRVFLPSCGGLENVMHLIATELSRAGHSVTVVTMTPAQGEDPGEYRILRRPSLPVFIREALRADVCLVANITLRTTPLLLLLIRCRVVTLHHGWYGRRHDPRDWLKNLLTHFTHNICCSEGVKRKIPRQGTVVPNGFASEIFHRRDEIPRDRDIVFLGRLVSEKGCDVLIKALGILRDHRIGANLTIVGTGPEFPRLESQVRKLSLGDVVMFAGRLEGDALARMLARHRILAVPSVWEEPFGIVALEGAACGCVVIGTDGGGLPEAIGPCGIVVRRADTMAFAEGLERLLTDRQLEDSCRQAAPAHLARHTQSAIGELYRLGLTRVAAGLSFVTECAGN